MSFHPLLPANLPLKLSSEGSPPLKLWLAGGGTGGHVYPALAVAEALSVTGQGQAATDASGLGHAAVNQIWYVGSEDGMERGLVQRESQLPFLAIPAAAVRGRGPISLARNSLTLARGTHVALRLLRRERPDAILGTGGYVCVPLFLAALISRTPTMIYLPDIVPGLAVRFLSLIASVTACNVEDAAQYLRQPVYELRQTGVQSEVVLPDIVAKPGQLHVVGYPVRAAVTRQDQAACRKVFGLSESLPVLLVYGGSRGARSVNQAIATLLPQLLPHTQIIHVCGREGDEQFLTQAVLALPAELQQRYRLYPYLHSEDGTTNQPTMVAAFGAADLSVCRSGASTLAELPAAGIPAVLVPYPYVHQDENADYLVRYGAAVKVADHAMLGTGRPEEGPLYQQIRRLLDQPSIRATMAEQSRALDRPGAARRLAALLLNLGGRRVLR